ncbi:DUF1816 domain-containing protein [Brunnivagina elsteri]|uniref:DUF1816 domain-containing protein n=1 Tax=Brunnivagina elsteri CCALA 953 TaxID=987040 RepID=A0A2A2TBY4_9CYAN|nr:DUF1816 domain-containing protein [Calothrix elsteri]PAX51213.1 hypothetical protein CK510_26005 [Calothrix elsteri CCALA 953]
MKFWNSIRNLIANYKSHRDWWIEVSTTHPSCVYYFGAFQYHQEAESMSLGYIEDLQAEGAREIKIQIKRCQPERLTVEDE